MSKVLRTSFAEPLSVSDKGTAEASPVRAFILPFSNSTASFKPRMILLYTFIPVHPSKFFGLPVRPISSEIIPYLIGFVNRIQKFSLNRTYSNLCIKQARKIHFAIQVFSCFLPPCLLLLRRAYKVFGKQTVLMDSTLKYHGFTVDRGRKKW